MYLGNSDLNIILLKSKPSNELHEYYSAADFAVFPLESTLSSLECQACKLPVIMEDNPTNCQRIKMGGLTYISGNISDLSGKMQMLINDPILRKRLSKDGFDYVCQNYDYFKSLAQMEEVLRTSLNQD
jgi:glycosyltransferase involved in cell wall biosynthesis